MRSQHPGAPARRPLEGLRVVDFGQYIAGPMAAVLLADQGADVIAIDPPGGRRWDHPAAESLGRGKRRVQLDPHTEAGTTTALRLIAGADVVIENFRPGVMDRLGLGYETASQNNPAVVYVSLPGFSRNDERRDIAGWDGILNAASGMYTNLSPAGAALGLPPIFTALPLPSVYAGLHGAIAAVAGIHGRDLNGHGDWIEVPLLDAAMSAAAGFILRTTDQPRRYNEPPLPSALLDRMRLRRLPSSVARAITSGVRALFPPFFRNYRTADGRTLFICAIDNRNHIDRLISALGLEQTASRLGFTFGDVLDIPATTTNIYAYRSHPRWTRLAFAIQKRILTFSAADIETRLAARGVPAGIQRTTAEWTAMTEMRSAGVVIATPDGMQPGLQVDLDSTTAVSGEPATAAPPLCDSSVDWLSTRQPFAMAIDTRPVGAEPVAPLTGVSVLDVANVIAGPAAARTLAELGADVVHVDPVSPVMGPRLLLHIGLDVNRGKQSIALDAKHAAGQKLLRQMISESDVVVYNKTPSQAQRLGLAPDDVHAINDRAVVCAVTAWGGSRPGAWDDRPGYDPVVQAVTGVMSRFGGVDTPAVHGVAATIDYFTGFSGAYATVVGLLARRQGARNIVGRTSLVRTAGWIQFPFLTEHLATAPTGQSAQGWHALDRLYRTRDSWIYVSARSSEWPRVRALLLQQGVMAGDVRFRDADGPIGKAFRRRRTAEALVLAGEMGIAAHEVVDAAHIRHGARAGDLGGSLITPDLASGEVLLAPHHSGFSVYLPDSTWNRPLRSPRRRLAPAPYPGEHTSSILARMGWSRADTDGEGMSYGWPTVAGDYLPR